MNEVELRVLVPLEEFKTLKRLAKEHQDCVKGAGYKSELKTEPTVLSDGSGTIDTHGEQRHEITVDQPTDQCQKTENIDQSVKLSPKEIVLDSKTVNGYKNIEDKKQLSPINVVSQLRQRYKKKGEKLLQLLLKNPEDFSFDGNGIVTIFKDTIPGKLEC